MVILTHITSHPDGISGKVLCSLLTEGNLAFVGAASSNITLTAIAFERYYAVVYPEGNKGNLNMRKVKVSKNYHKKKKKQYKGGIIFKVPLTQKFCFFLRWLNMCNKGIEA